MRLPLSEERAKGVLSASLRSRNRSLMPLFANLDVRVYIPAFCGPARVTGAAIHLVVSARNQMALVGAEENGVRRDAFQRER